MRPISLNHTGQMMAALAAALWISGSAADEFHSDQNRLMWPRIKGPSSERTKAAPADPALGNSGRPEFFYARALHCPGSPYNERRNRRLCFERVRPDRRIYRATEQEFLGSLVPNVPICVVVHGSFISDAEHAEFIREYQWIRQAAPDYPLHVVFYRWPSSPGPQIILPQLQVEQLALRAESHGVHLAKLLRRLPAENPIGIVAHSHGTRCVASALHLLAGGRIRHLRLPERAPGRRYRVVFGAAAIDHHWLNPNQLYGRALDSTEYLINLRSRRDWALALYPYRKAFSQPALGMAGFTPYDQVQLGTAMQKVRQIDVTRIVGSGHSERAYSPHRSISRSFAGYLYFIDRSQLANDRVSPGVIRDSSIQSREQAAL